MFRCSFILSIFLLCVSLSYGTAAAEERVFRLQTGTEAFGTKILYYPSRIHYLREDQLQSTTFVVYTVEEVNSRISPLAAANTQHEKALAELQGIVDGLRKNIKALSDVNDALTRRVEELEKRLANTRVSQ